jgi:hypothetical protein
MSSQSQLTKPAFTLDLRGVLNEDRVSAFDEFAGAEGAESVGETTAGQAVAGEVG